MGYGRVTLGPVASHSWLHQPEHIAFQLSRYRAASALIGDAETVLEVGCGEGIGAGILAKNREMYVGCDLDADAIATANEILTQRGRTDRRRMSFVVSDVLNDPPDQHDEPPFDAVVSLDVLEHIPAEREGDFMHVVADLLSVTGVLVIGTPSKHAEHLASPQSKVGHINLYTPERLRALMTKHFHVVQLMGMQDTSVHWGHLGMFHYVIAVGIGPR